MPASSSAPAPGYTLRRAYHTVASDTTPGAVDAVDLDRTTGRPVHCTCPDFRYRRAGRSQWCKHMARVLTGAAGKPHLVVRPVPPAPARPIAAPAAAPPAWAAQAQQQARQQRERSQAAARQVSASVLYDD